MKRLFALVGCVLVLAGASAEAKRGVEPVFAEGAQDPALIGNLAALGPNVDLEEARRIAFTAYTTGREFQREWRVVWPPGYQNFLVHRGRRRAGLCFQWAAALLFRLEALKLKSVELHWAESFPGSLSEHNVIIVTAPGQPLGYGILLDNWRYGGRLLWGRASADPHYNWKENAAEMRYRLRSHSLAAHGRELR